MHIEKLELLSMNTHTHTHTAMFLDVLWVNSRVYSARFFSGLIAEKENLQETMFCYLFVPVTITTGVSGRLSPYPPFTPIQCVLRIPTARHDQQLEDLEDLGVLKVDHVPSGTLQRLPFFLWTKG